MRRAWGCVRRDGCSKRSMFDGAADQDDRVVVTAPFEPEIEPLCPRTRPRSPARAAARRSARRSSGSQRERVIRASGHRSTSSASIFAIRGSPDPRSWCGTRSSITRIRSSAWRPGAARRMRRFSRSARRGRRRSRRSAQRSVKILRLIRHEPRAPAGSHRRVGASLVSAGSKTVASRAPWSLKHRSASS